MALLTNQWNASNYKDPERQRIYLKDIDCPPLWHDKLSQLLPPALFYLNDSTGEKGGPGASIVPNGSGAGIRKGRGIAQAGDLMSSLPSEMRAENLMCYIGHEGTYTPAHREMCASLGQNIMVETSTGLVEDGKPTKPGSSVWFMTESKDRDVVSEYWLSALGHDIEVESHFAQINAWKAAPFKTYVVEQRVGDFILIPPLAPHQVWNRGTRTMKVAWNRTTVETLEMALSEALPRARMVCRDEQYKNKAIIYYTLIKYSKLLSVASTVRQRTSGKPPPKIRQLQKDFRRLHAMYTGILMSESFEPGHEERKVEYMPYDGNITCSYCRGNIFNRFLTCPSCVGKLPNEDDDIYDICMECYAMGRSCLCISKLKWVEQFRWGELTEKHEQWRRQVVQLEGQLKEKSPGSLAAEIERHGKRTLAAICQMELKKRPFKDVKKLETGPRARANSEEVEADREGVVRQKKRKVRLSEKFKKEHKVCHVHTIWEPKWKQAECPKCSSSFCFGLLARAYDMKPQDIFADKEWTCPRCRHFCICRRCREKPDWKMIEPPRIMLGHDTKKVADPRSVESLVDYSQSNISWLQKVGDDGSKDTRRLEKRQEAAAQAKAAAPELSHNYVEETAMTNQADQAVERRVLILAQQEGIPIDPSLNCETQAATTENGLPEEQNEVYNENPEEAVLDDQYEIYHQDPPHAQNVMPGRGVIRSAEHAYDATEAITFDYPDPDMDTQMSPAQGEKSPCQPEGIPCYEPAALSEELADIEMVPKKRQKLRPDPSSLPYRSHIAVRDIDGRKRKKPRKSLVVKLSLNKDKLSELNQMVLIARQALRGVGQGEAPVIGSDLQALNLGSGTAAVQAPPKRNRIEPEDVDDDFAAPRVRKDRQRIFTPEVPLVSTRRTRTQNIAYDEPSDVESVEDSVGSDQPSSSNSYQRRQYASKRPHIRPRVSIVQDEVADKADQASFTTSHSNSDTLAPPRNTEQHISSDDTNLSEYDSGLATNNHKSETVHSFTHVNDPSISLNNNNDNKNNTRDYNFSMTTRPPAQRSQADENRRAKLAALNWAEGNGYSDIDGGDEF